MTLKKQNPLPLIKLLKQNLLLSLTGFIFFITSCSHHQKVKNIFHYNEQSGIATLDPAFAKNQSIMWAVHQLYNTLVQIDNNMNLVPSLAKSWDESEDNLTFTFHLRNDVFFQDNAAFPGGK